MVRFTRTLIWITAITQSCLGTSRVLWRGWIRTGRRRRRGGGRRGGWEGSYLKGGPKGKPLIWDQKSEGAVPFDQGEVDPALEGSFEVGGEKCQPAFQALREHVKRYTPERVAPITTISADTIRRIAKEFGEAARIGSTIMIDGKVLPYRPVAVNIYRGAGAHKHGTPTGLSVQTHYLVDGVSYVPGGPRGINLLG